MTDIDVILNKKSQKSIENGVVTFDNVNNKIYLGNGTKAFLYGEYKDACLLVNDKNELQIVSEGGLSGQALTAFVNAHNKLVGMKQITEWTDVMLTTKLFSDSNENYYIAYDELYDGIYPSKYPNGTALNIVFNENGNPFFDYDEGYNLISSSYPNNTLCNNVIFAYPGSITYTSVSNGQYDLLGTPDATYTEENPYVVYLKFSGYEYLTGLNNLYADNLGADQYSFYILSDVVSTYYEYPLRNSYRPVCFYYCGGDWDYGSQQTPGGRFSDRMFNGRTYGYINGLATDLFMGKAILKLSTYFGYPDNSYNYDMTQLYWRSDLYVSYDFGITWTQISGWCSTRGGD